MRSRLEDRSANKADNRARCKLEHRQNKRIAVFDRTRRYDNMQAVKQTAADREDIADINAQILVKAHKAHADKAHEGCDNIISVRFFMRYRPIQERNEDAVSRSEKGVLSGGSVH